MMLKGRSRRGSFAFLFDYGWFIKRVNDATVQIEYLLTIIKVIRDIVGKFQQRCKVAGNYFYLIFVKNMVLRVIYY